MRLPVSFDEAAYFGKEYRGDLIITHGVIYYFPHTNTTLERGRKNTPGALDGVTALMGPAGEAIHLGLVFYRAAAGLWRRLRGPTINRPRLKSEGLWAVGASSREMQARLDTYVALRRREASRLVAYELTLPKPMRFPSAEMRGVSVRLGELKFETEFDRHDFTVGLRRGRLLREALREGGFIV